MLLQPELINNYAQAVIRTLRDDPMERGCVTEERVLAGELNYPPDFARLPEVEELIVLRAMHKLLVERAVCLRDQDPQGKRSTLLVFPSHFRRQRPDRPDEPQFFMTYSFAGSLDEVYATLVVRLHYSGPFDNRDLWRNAADFATTTEHRIGVRLVPRHDGTGELQVHCDTTTPVSEQVMFAKYVQDHLHTKATAVIRLRTYICGECSTPVENRDAARRRLEDAKGDIGCSYCDARIPLWDDLEQQLASPDVRARVDELRRVAQVVLDSESRARVLVGEVYAMAARANQIAREVTVSDHGIDMEIEFKDDHDRATGTKLYLQLKSGDSHLRHRSRGDRRIFRIDKPRHAGYWADQAFPVMLIVMDSAGVIEWMEIRELLRRQRTQGPWPATQIDFIGEPFDVMSIRRRRDQLLGSVDRTR